MSKTNLSLADMAASLPVSKTSAPSITQFSGGQLRDPLAPQGPGAKPALALPAMPALSLPQGNPDFFAGMNVPGSLELGGLLTGGGAPNNPPPSGEGPPGGNTSGGYEVGQPNTGGEPDLAQPGPGQAGSGNPGAISDVNDMIGQLNNLHNLGGSVPDNFELTTNAPTTFEGDWRDAALGGLLAGPGGAYLAYQMGGEATPVEPAVTGPGIVNMWGEVPEGFEGMGPGGGEWLDPGSIDASNLPTSGEAGAEDVDLTMPTTGNSTEGGETAEADAGIPFISTVGPGGAESIEYGGLPGLSPIAAAVINRRISRPTERQR